MFHYLPCGASQSCARMQISHVRQCQFVWVSDKWAQIMICRCRTVKHILTNCTNCTSWATKANRKICSDSLAYFMSDQAYLAHIKSLLLEMSSLTFWKKSGLSKLGAYRLTNVIWTEFYYHKPTVGINNCRGLNERDIFRQPPRFSREISSTQLTLRPDLHEDACG